MMREVIDYKDIRRLKDTPINSLIEKGIVITATSELASAMKRYYPGYKVYDIHALISSIIPEWEKDVKDIKNYVMLRDVIEDYVNDNEVRGETATYLRRNAGNMWDAIKLLIEADVFPDDIAPESSEPIGRFGDIWKKLEIRNKRIVSFRSMLAYHLSQAKIVAGKIKGLVGDIRKEFFLFGFYFITPIQDRIFDILEGAGTRLVFLNCHDAGYKDAMIVWEKTFPQYREGNVRQLQEDINPCNPFGDILKGEIKGIPAEMANRIDAPKKHYTDFDFAQMVCDAIQKGEKVYSPDAKQCERILKEYFPDFYEQKHLLSYPVGQYIYYLHMLWDSFSNMMDVKYEYVVKCFASGWLTKDDYNGKDYLYEMKILEPFFKFCRTIDDWKERLGLLKEAQAALSPFETRDKGKERWHALLGNPFNNMGIYTIPEKKIDGISLLIDKLFEDAGYLFASSNKVNLFEHFQKITSIIRQHTDKEGILQEEQEIVAELIAQLSDDSTREIKCPLNGIRDAIILLIGDHFGDYETQDEETSRKKQMVLPLSMVEAAILDTGAKKFHLVLANEFTLPGQPKKLPWPLTDEMLASLQIKGAERSKTRKYLEDMRSVIENRPLSYRYLYYSFIDALNNDNQPRLSMEWVCKKENKDVEVSSYVKLLEPEKWADNKDLGGSKISKEYLSASVPDGYRRNSPEIPADTVDLPEEVKMDYLVCTERYTYSYLLNYLPAYVSEFHYPFELSKLISCFAFLSGVKKEVVSHKVSELFPFLRHIEIRQSTDFASSTGNPEPYFFDGIEYPGQRLLTHYLDKVVLEDARKRLEEAREKGWGFAGQGKAVNKEQETSCKKCIYCPYAEICLRRHKEESVEYNG